MLINTNISSLNAQRSYQRAGEQLATSMQRLSSGQRINSARDDAAGLAVSERMGATVRGLDRAGKNINDGISLLQVADGAAGQLIDNFQRIRELAVQAANATYSTSDRAAIQAEADALVASNEDIVSGTRFNQVKLLDGNYNVQLQVGADAGQTVQVTIPPALAPHGYQLALVDIAPQQVDFTGTAVLGALSAGALVLGPTSIVASVAGAQPGQSSDSAYAIAAAINASNVKDVSASASTAVSVGVASSGGIPNAGIAVNGINIGPIAGANANARAASAAAAINAASGASGVVASASGGTLSLAASDGRNIVISESGAGFAASLGLGLGAYTGTVRISDLAVPGSHSITVGGSNPALAGLASGPKLSVVSGPPQPAPANAASPGEPKIDLGTAGGATAALDYIDGKIDAILDIRSQLGATQNSLAAAYDNTAIGASNLQAARSRIRDTDYASETAQLTRAQILRQAGASIVAQANALPQQALLLLR